VDKKLADFGSQADAEVAKMKEDVKRGREIK